MKIKKIIIFGLILVALSASIYVVRAASRGFTGFSWIGNNLQGGLEQGDPIIGMISLKGTNHEVMIEGSSDQSRLVGSAWLGIGSTNDKFNDFTNQNDYPSIGWIHFNQPFDQAKLSSLISANCFGAGDCWGVRWNKKPGLSPNSTSPEGYLSGWARMEIGPNGDSTAYPDIWVHFKSPVNPANYTCNENEHNYYVCLDGNGQLEGYAWSSGAEATSVDGNPGLGWIRFSKQFVKLTEVGVISSSKYFCAVLLDSESSGIGCKNDNSFNGNFEFKAYQFGFDSPSYQWDCKDGEVVGETNEAKVTCNYTILGEHTPTLKINGELCSNQTTVKVTTVSSCSILARKASTGDKEEFSKSASIAQGDLAEAKINRQCLDGGVIKWTLAGGTRTYENGDNITISPSGATDIKISAQITKDNKTYGCGSADIKVTEKVKWR